MNRGPLIKKMSRTVLATAALIFFGAYPVAARSDLLAQGRSAARHHDCDRAITLLSQAIAQNLDDKAAYEARGLCYLSDKEKRTTLRARTSTP